MQVWQKLEEQNPDFFKAYITRLKLKDQINLFNHLLEQQIQVSSSLCDDAAAHLPVKVAGLEGGMAAPVSFAYMNPACSSRSAWLPWRLAPPALAQRVCLAVSWVVKGITPALGLVYKVTWCLREAAGLGEQLLVAYVPCARVTSTEHACCTWCSWCSRAAWPCSDRAALPCR